MTDPLPMVTSMRHHRTPRPVRGFTLIELMVVVVIIGILMGFVLQAAVDGKRRAEARATQALLIKLDTAMGDRMEALQSTNAPVTAGHLLLSTIINPATSLPYGSMDSSQRAQVIAQVDMMKYEVPDTFYVQVNPANITNTPGYPVIYPLNFGGQPWSGIPVGSVTTTYFQPLGWPTPLGSTGVFGASYAAAAGVYKNLGYLPQGYDQQDNNGDGFIDDWSEGVTAVNFNQVVQNLTNHMQHPETARAEMLYAILVEGKSPVGSTMDPDDFKDSEVQDTDNDGLPEFIDAWRQPLQFYRWPTHYQSDVQKGSRLYSGFLEPRQLYPLDPGQQLVAPGWWTDLNNPGQLSLNAALFQLNFFSLIDPNGNTAQTAGTLWDRSGFFQRREFYCRFLIISSGPDLQLGLAQLGVNYAVNPEVQDGSGAPIPINPNAGSYPGDSTNIILV
ncbi:MAG TPA: type II secretion system protein, partial [Isosphaeraceae bacterium]|nr:type II secretion system protein [Isosphaeraceae bacterium]